MTTIATANLGNHSDSHVREGLDRLAKQAWVIGCQEAGDRHRMLDRFRMDQGWEMHYEAKQEGATATPILWNPFKVEATHGGCRPATKSTNCGRLGAGPNTVKAKVFNHVRVRPITGDKPDDPFVFINGHWPASLYLPCRRALGRRMVAILDDMVENREDMVDVVAVGDFNMTPRDPLTRPLREREMVQHTDFPTHGLRTIDHVWTLGRRAEAYPFKGSYSDHHWVLADLS